MKCIVLKEKNKLTDKEVQNRIKKVTWAMAQEGMPLTQQEEETIKNCILGMTTHEIERNKIITQCSSVYGG